MRKILILTGSPRKGGNSDLMAEAFKAGAEKAGHQVTLVRCADLKINGCLACDQCFSQGRACVVDDDFNQLAPLLESHDLLALAAPVYWYTFPAQLKAALDKFYALMVAQRPFGFKETVLLGCGEDTAENMFDGMARTYELIIGFLKMEDRGRVWAPGVLKKGEVKTTEALARAEALGAGL